MNFLNKISISEKIIHWLIIAILLISILFTISYNDAFHSAEDYSIAMNIAKGNGFVYLQQLGFTSVKAPIYPYYIAFFIKVFGQSAKFWLVISHHFLFALVPIVVLKASKLTKMREISKYFCFMMLLHPTYFVYRNVIESTNLFVPLSVISVCMVALFWANPSNVKAISVAFLLAILILLQPIVIPLVVLFFIYLALKKKKPIMIITISLLLISPWLIRNYQVHNQFVMVKSPFWYNLYHGYLPEFIGTNKFNIIESKVAKYIDTIRWQMSDVEMEKIYKDEFLNATSKNLGVYFNRTLFNFSNYWGIVPRYDQDFSIKFLLIRRVPVYILNILFILSLLYIMKYERKYLLMPVLALAYFTFIYSIFFASNIRFKLDIEWVQIFIIALALAKLQSNQGNVIVSVEKIA